MTQYSNVSIFSPVCFQISAGGADSVIDGFLVELICVLMDALYKMSQCSVSRAVKYSRVRKTGFHRTLSSTSHQSVPPAHLRSFSRSVLNLTTLHLILIFYAPSNNATEVIKKTLLFCGQLIKANENPVASHFGDFSFVQSRGFNIKKYIK